ncbi:MAG: sulfatase-like hydrolase/transferase [Thiohalocapsa sp.]
MYATYRRREPSAVTTYVLRVLLALLLSVPLLGAHYYAQPRSLTWLMLALLGLGLSLAFIYVLVSSPRRDVWSMGLGVLALQVLAMLQLTRFVSFYFQGESFNQRFFFHFNFNTLTEAGAAYLPLIGISLLYLMVVALLSWFSCDAIPRERHPGQGRAALLSLALLILLPMTEPDLRRLADTGRNLALRHSSELTVDTLAWRELGLNSAALERHLADTKPGKNLVLIYLESLESLYLDDAVFPGLTPNLNRLREQGLSFTGLKQVAGTNWTVGGIVASQCGTPMIYRFGPGSADALQSGFLGRATCLGDVMEAAGYQQVFLGGASTRFAGKGQFLRAHGYDEANGSEELLPQLEDPTYRNGWGLYDDSLFAIAEQRYFELAESRQPFNLTLLTIDTHPPTGEPSDSCPAYEAIDNAMLDAVHCTDYLVGRFIDRLRQHPAWKDTVVALLSDHLAMRNIAHRYYPKDYSRRLFFTVLNGGQTGQVPVQGSHLDLAPTLLQVLGVEHRQPFLAGRNLLESELPPVIEARPVGREAAFRFINSQLLTSSGRGLCEAPRLLQVTNGRLRLAGKEAPLSFAGYPISIEQLGKDYTFLALLDKQGSIYSTMVVNSINFGHVLYQFRDWPFVALLAAADIPEYLDVDISGDGIVALLGSLQGEIRLISEVASMSALDVALDDCQEQFDSVQDSVGERQISLHELCADSGTSTAHFDPDTKSIELRRVALLDSWFQGRVEQSAPGAFQLTEYHRLGRINSSAFEPHGVCHAYFGSGELIIPSMPTEEVSQAMRLRRVSTTEWRFEVLESSTF